MTNVVGGSGWGVTHLILKSPLAAVCVGCAAVVGFAFGDDGDMKPVVSFTFDDATSAQHETVLPMMSERDLLGTLYVSTGLIDTDPTDEQGFYMTDAQVMDFVDAGWEIGAHSIDHANLLEMDQITLMKNLSVPKSYIQENYNLLATSFSSPYGEYNEDVQRATSMFYQNHVNSWSDKNGINFAGNFNPYEVHRVSLTLETDPVEVCSTVRALPDNTWFTMVVHKVAPAGDPSLGFWDTTEETFAQILDCVAAARDTGDLTVNRVTETALKMEERSEFVEVMVEIPADVIDSTVETASAD